MTHATIFQSAPDIEWHQVEGYMPEWVSYSIGAGILLAIVAMMVIASHINKKFERDGWEVLLVIIGFLASLGVIILIVSGISLYSTKAANKENLQDAYGTDLSEASEKFLVHGTDITITDYKLPDGKIEDTTFRVELTEHDGAMRGKLVTVKKDGSTQDVPQTETHSQNGESGAFTTEASSKQSVEHNKSDSLKNRDSEAREYLERIIGSHEEKAQKEPQDASNTESSDSSGSQTNKPDKGDGLKIRDREVQEYLNSVTRSDAILEGLRDVTDKLQDATDKLRDVDERLAKVENKL